MCKLPARWASSTLINKQRTNPWPRQITIDEIRGIVNDFRLVARNAIETGSCRSPTYHAIKRYHTLTFIDPQLKCRI